MALKADRSHLGTQRHLTRQNWYISKPTGSHVSLSYQRQVKDLAQSQQTAAGVRLRMDECLWVNSWLAGGEEQTEGEEGRKSCLCPSVCVCVLERDRGKERERLMCAVDWKICRWGEAFWSVCLATPTLSLAHMNLLFVDKTISTPGPHRVFISAQLSWCCRHGDNWENSICSWRPWDVVETRAKASKWTLSQVFLSNYFQG